MNQRLITREFIENLDINLLIQAMIGNIGIFKTRDIISYYIELREADLNGELPQGSQQKKPFEN